MCSKHFDTHYYLDRQLPRNNDININKQQHSKEALQPGCLLGAQKPAFRQNSFIVWVIRENSCLYLF